MDRQVLNSIKLLSHARGIVFYDISTADAKKLRDNSEEDLQQLADDEDDEKKKNKWIALKVLKKDLNEIRDGPEWCGKLSNEYKNDMLLKEDLYRTDYKMTIAYQVDDEDRSVKIVGICSYGDADSNNADGTPNEERQFEDDDLNNDIAQQKTLEIDLLCTLNALKGTGSLLLSFVIAKQFTRKSKGLNKYESAIIECFGYKEGRGRNRRIVRPILNITYRLGFEDAPLVEPLPEATGIDATPHMVKLIGDGALEKFFEGAAPKDQMGHLEKLCSTKPRSGLKTCN